MLADFALRLACGLAFLLLATPWRAVPPAFFRTHCLVILGLLVLAALDLARLDGVGPLAAATIGAAVLGYLAAVTWGLGLVRVAVPVTALLALTTGGVLVAMSRGGGWELTALNASGRLASAFLLGSTLTAMLLGHYYLTAPAMSIEPLKRFVRFMAVALAARTVFAALGLGLWSSGVLVPHPTATAAPLFLAIRWGMGLVGPLVATILTWKTVAIRATQSATGILYIAMTLVLFGELTALIVSREVGLVF